MAKIKIKKKKKKKKRGHSLEILEENGSSQEPVDLVSYVPCLPNKISMKTGMSFQRTEA